MNKVSVYYWEYHNGVDLPPNAALLKSLDIDCEPNPKGYTCHVFTDEPESFENWMKRNIIGSYDCTWRFNSGNPMYTVFIKDDEDAMLFKLKWSVK